MDDPVVVPLSLEMGPDRVFLALPRTGTGPGLILLHDIRGVDDRIRELARLYADEGYVVAIPDLFWLSGIEATEAVGAMLDWEFWFFQDEMVEHGGPEPPAGVRLALEPSLEDVEHVIEALRAHEACTGKVGIVGYGLGGTIAVYAAARLGVDAVVAHDPAGLARVAPELVKRSAPLLVHEGAGDSLAESAEAESFRAATAATRHVTVHVYPGEPCDFALAGPSSGDAGVLLAQGRTIAHLRRHLGPCYDLEALWDAHVKALLVSRDAAAAVAQLSREPYVSCVPTLVGGRGIEEVRAFYEQRLLPALPADSRLVPVSRTLGADRIADELVLAFTHDRPMEFLLPGVVPSFRRLAVPLVALVSFRGDRISHVRVYWDQASLLAQIGRIDERSLPVSGLDEAQKVLDETFHATPAFI